MRANRFLMEYLLAALLGLTAATIVIWQLESSDSTSCFRQSVKISIAESDDTVKGCV